MALQHDPQLLKYLALERGPSATMMRLATILNRFSFYRFTFVAAFITFFVSILVGWFYRYFVDGFNIFSFPLFFIIPSHPIQKFYLAVFFHPLFETIIDQWLLINLLQKGKIPEKWIIIINTVLFSLGHLSNSFLSAINTLFTGLVLNFSYFYWLNRCQSKKLAFESSLSIHALHNFYHYILMFIR